jgi:hypothetical protein
LEPVNELLCDNKAMPDDNDSASVEQQGIHHSAESEAISPPPTPDNVPSTPAQGVTGKGVDSAVHGIQDRLKRAEWLMIALTAVIAVSAFCQAMAGYFQWNAMRAQLDEMRQSVVLGQRPWLGIELYPTVEVEGDRWKVVFAVKNYGQSPSLHSVFASEVAYAPLDSAAAHAKAEEACSRGEELTGIGLYPTTPGEHGYTIFPGASQLQDMSLSPYPKAPAYLIGCLTYLDEFGALHHTRFCEAAAVLPIGSGTRLTPCFAGQEAE